MLFLCTVAAVAAWWGANQRAERAIQEAVRLRMQLQQYQAELGELSVIDPTKVHAIGLRLRPEDQQRWKWRIFLPPKRKWQLLLVDGAQALDRGAILQQFQGHGATNQIMAVEVQPGEFLMEAAIISREADKPQLALSCAINGRPCLELPLPEFDTAKYDLEVTVGPNDRHVWEPGEQPLLLSLREVSTSTATRTIAIWLWEQPAAESTRDARQALQQGKQSTR